MRVAPTEYKTDGVTKQVCLLLLLMNIGLVWVGAARLHPTCARKYAVAAAADTVAGAGRGAAVD